MSHSLGKRISTECMGIIGPEAVNRKKSAIFVITVDHEMYPHTALLSPYQVLSSGENSIFLSMFPDSKTCKLLTEQGKATLIIQTVPGVTYVKCNVSVLPYEISVSGSMRKVFRAVPYEVLEDVSELAPFTGELLFDAGRIQEQYMEEFRELSNLVNIYH